MGSMSLFYILPALAFLIVIILLQLLLREFSISRKTRRVIFSLSFAFLLSPSIIPAGVIFTAYIPSGLLIMTGGVPLAHTEKLVGFAFISFMSTWIFGYLISIFTIKDISVKTGSLKRKTSLILSLLVTITTIVFFTYQLTPNRNVDSRINWVILETRYGEDFETLRTLGEIESFDAFNSKIHQLREKLSADPLITQLSISDKRFKKHSDNSLLNLVQKKSSARTCSSSGSISWHQERIMRCTNRSSKIGKFETLVYKRVSISLDGSTLVSMEIELDYKKLLDFVSTASVINTANVDTETHLFNNERVLGEWLIHQRSRLTATEKVEQTGKLTVGPLTDSGYYKFNAEIEAQITLRKGKSNYSIAGCEEAVDRCILHKSATGRLKIVGNRVLLLFDDRFWLSDRLDLENGLMLGRDDWGNVTVLKRANNP